MNMDAWVLIILIVVILPGALWIQSCDISNKKKAVDDYWSSIPDFSVTREVMGNDGNTGLAIDEQKRKICLIDYKKERVSGRVVSYKDLLSCELFEDGATVTKTVRSSQIGSALIGGLALGGVGAIIGALSGKTQTSAGKVKRIDLRLIVNDTKNPLHDLNFLSRGRKKDSLAYQQAMQSARHWHGLVEVLIKQAEGEDKMDPATVPQSKQSSVADELRKLADLKDTGVLSMEEFQQQKARLLSL